MKKTLRCVKKTTKQKTPKKRITKPKLYTLEMVFNGERFKKNTNNLDEAIVSMKPETLYTEVYVTASKGKELSERRLNLVQGKRLFLIEDFREIFINNLLLT